MFQITYFDGWHLYSKIVAASDVVQAIEYSNIKMVNMILKIERIADDAADG